MELAGDLTGAVLLELSVEGLSGWAQQRTELDKSETMTLQLLQASVLLTNKLDEIPLQAPKRITSPPCLEIR